MGRPSTRFEENEGRDVILILLSVGALRGLVLAVLVAGYLVLALLPEPLLISPNTAGIGFIVAVFAGLGTVLLLRQPATVGESRLCTPSGCGGCCCEDRMPVLGF